MDVILLTKVANLGNIGDRVKVKSGYGLTVEDELKTLRAIRRLSADESLPRLIPTFLGAHAIPPEFASDREAYVRLVIDEMLPAVVEEELAVFCDVFCEEGAFTLEESERIWPFSELIMAGPGEVVMRASCPRGN